MQTDPSSFRAFKQREKNVIPVRCLTLTCKNVLSAMFRKHFEKQDTLHLMYLLVSLCTCSLLKQYFSFMLMKVVQNFFLLSFKNKTLQSIVIPK